MKNLFLIIQILTGLFVIGSITIQTKGTGFTRSWKAQSSFTRRGLEKIVFKLTFAVSGIFLAVSILQIAL